MNKTYSIGYTDSYGDFVKVYDSKGYTKKFNTLEEARSYIKNEVMSYVNKKSGTKNNIFKIMQGWNIIEIVEALI